MPDANKICRFHHLNGFVFEPRAKLDPLTGPRFAGFTVREEEETNVDYLNNIFLITRYADVNCILSVS